MHVGKPSSLVVNLLLATAALGFATRVLQAEVARIEIATGFDRPTLVSVSQQALPGWRVDVDGEPADVVVVDGLFLGVRVPEGDHSISFRYESPWLRTSLLISLAAAATTIALAVGATITARGRTPQAAGGGNR